VTELLRAQQSQPPQDEQPRHQRLTQLRHTPAFNRSSRRPADRPLGHIHPGRRRGSRSWGLGAHALGTDQRLRDLARLTASVSSMRLTPLLSALAKSSGHSS
jgi:hypothetical protein